MAAALESSQAVVNMRAVNLGTGCRSIAASRNNIRSRIELERFFVRIFQLFREHRGIVRSGPAGPQPTVRQGPGDDRRSDSLRIGRFIRVCGSRLRHGGADGACVGTLSPGHGYVHRQRTRDAQAREAEIDAVFGKDRGKGNGHYRLRGAVVRRGFLGENRSPRTSRRFAIAICADRGRAEAERLFHPLRHDVDRPRLGSGSSPAIVALPRASYPERD